MYNRYDSSKGRSVTYEYQAKDDRFSRGLATLPRVWTNVRRFETGRAFKRRTRTNEAQYLTVGLLKSWLRSRVTASLENHTLYFLEVEGKLHVGEKPPGFPVRFDVTAQAKGKRHWFFCMGCGRRAGKLFVAPTKQGAIWGCQKCLGLAYPSQAQHKTQARDRAIVEGKVKVSFKEWVRASEREKQRMQRLIGRLERLT
jgi:hypothetical protein